MHCRGPFTGGELVDHHAADESAHEEPKRQHEDPVQRLHAPADIFRRDLVNVHVADRHEAAEAEAVQSLSRPGQPDPRREGHVKHEDRRNNRARSKYAINPSSIVRLKPNDLIISPSAASTPSSHIWPTELMRCSQAPQLPVSRMLRRNGLYQATTNWCTIAIRKLTTINTRKSWRRSREITTPGA